MNDEKATTTTTGFGARGPKAPPPSQEQGGKSPHPLKMFAGIEEKPSPSKGLESLFHPGPHGFSDLPAVLLCTVWKNSL